MHDFRDDCNGAVEDVSARYFFIYCFCQSKTKMLPAQPHLGVPYAMEVPDPCCNVALVVRPDALQTKDLPLEHQSYTAEGGGLANIYHDAVDPSRVLDY